MDQIPYHSSKPFSSEQVSSKQIVAVSRSDRWQLYHRLRELDIPCACLRDGRFEVEVHSPIAAIQLWSVVRQLTAPRQPLSRWLEQCWQLPCSDGSDDSSRQS